MNTEILAKLAAKTIQLALKVELFMHLQCIVEIWKKELKKKNTRNKQ